MNKIFLPIVLALAGLLSGCFPPTTTHPIGTVAGLKPDPALTGLWRGQMEKSDSNSRQTYFHFLPMLDGTITVVMVQGGTKPDGDWMVASITTATLGANHILNATMRFSAKGEDKDDAAHGTIPLLYRAEGGNRIAMFMLNEDAAKVAIKAGKIAGTVEPGSMGDASITATPAALDKFFASKEGAAMFKDRFATLTKVE